MSNNEEQVKAIIHASAMLSTSMRMVGSQLAGLLMANTITTAFAFHQRQKGSALTLEEMEEIKEELFDDINRYASANADILMSGDD